MCRRRFAGALVVLLATAGVAGCGSGERDLETPAAEAAHDLARQKVPGVGTVKQAQCFDPPLHCIVHNADGWAATCDVAATSEGQRELDCERAQPVSKAVLAKWCSDREAEHFEDGASSLDFECAMSRTPGK